MKIAVAGATGVLGSQVITALQEAGHEPIGFSRSTGFDVVSGEGLAQKLLGTDAVIDASATVSISAKGSTSFFTTATKQLLAAERAAGVTHHVAISIIGAANVNANYYAGKRAQEELLFRQPHGWSLLRTTQFHEFVPQLIRHGAFGPVQIVPLMRSQPISAAEVARELVTIATGAPQGLVPDLAVPREERMAVMADRYLTATGRPRKVIELPLPGAWGRGMGDGSLLPRPGTRQGLQTFDAWLEA